MKKTTLSVATLNQWSMDFHGNRERIIESLKQSRAANAKVRIGPELEIPGYGCEDHFFEIDTIEHSWRVLADLLQFTSSSPYNDLLCVFGMPLLLKSKVYNCGVCTYAGKIIGIKPKLILADDGNYRESRWFTPWELSERTLEIDVPECVALVTGSHKALFGNFLIKSADGFLIGSECCEELWAPMPSSTALYSQGAHIVFNISGSHYQPGKQQRREALVRSVTLKNGGIYMYSNYNGCDGTRLYFDAASFIMLNGRHSATAEQYAIKDVDVISACVDLARVESYRMPSQVPDLSQNIFFGHEYKVLDVPGFFLIQHKCKLSREPEPYVYIKEKELSFGPACWLWDYLRRSRANGLFLPLSGGADSASTLAFVGIMCELVMKSLSQTGYNREVIEKDLNRIIGTVPSSAKEMAGLLMHTAYLSTKNSSQTTRDCAAKIASEVGSKHFEICMDKIVESFKKTYMLMSGASEPRYLENGGSWAEDVALQNIQARSRMVMSYMLGQVLKASSDTGGFLLVLASGNLEEGLTGYMTKYDCSSADVNLIGGISKVDLKAFMFWASETFSYTGLRDIAFAPPTAELKPLEAGKVLQTDEDDLGMTYVEMSQLGRLRRIEHLGPYFTFKRLLFEWKDLGKEKIATKVKRFYTLYGRNRHKMNVVTPSVHVEGYSADDNRFDKRQMLYNYNWLSQFRSIDELLKVTI